MGGSGGQRHRTVYTPNFRPSARSGGLIALQPLTIGAFLLTSIGMAALIALILIYTGRAGGSSPQLARCVDATVRFPGAADPRAAVVAAYRQNGVDPEATRPGSARLTDQQASQVAAGWMGVSLMLEHTGQPAPTLASWLSTDPNSPTLANAMVSGRALDGIMSADEWAEARSWPATTCEGAFLHDPRNTSLVQSIEGVVAR